MMITVIKMPLGSCFHHHYPLPTNQPTAASRPGVQLLFYLFSMLLMCPFIYFGFNGVRSVGDGLGGGSGQVVVVLVLVVMVDVDSSVSGGSVNGVGCRVHGGGSSANGCG